MAEKDQLHHAPYGGQAVIEGVMMRSPRYYAVACRKPDSEIVVRQETVESYLKRFVWLNKPLLRGTLALIDSMVMGVKALLFSADVQMAAIQPEKKADAPAAEAVAGGPTEPVLQAKPRKGALKEGQSINDIAIGATVVFALAMAVGLFYMLPVWLANLAGIQDQKSAQFHAFEGAVRMVLFIGYVLSISRMKDIRRVFQYHGAEHMVINALEAGLELTPENIRKHTTIHPRCGTSFIAFVLLFSIIVFWVSSVALQWGGNIWQTMLFRLALLPVVAGVGYEIIRLAGRFKESVAFKAILWPGLWLQRLTTREPEDEMIEVALAALIAVREKENSDVEVMVI